jgi:GT2 family glycosyltransferase
MNDAPSKPGATRVCALLTCFNRRETTLACLAALGASTGVEGVTLRAVLVDDASTDGTAAAVRERFPWVEVIEAEGDLYWCRGMHRAFARALEQGHDHYLWLNDDTLLDADALVRLLACHDHIVQGQRAAVLVVGSTRDPHSGRHTYGGENRVSAWRPVRFRLAAPQAVAQRVDTFDGNVVLVSAAAAAVVGNLDPRFEHSMGDADYGLRAGRRGVPTWLAPGMHGTCSVNPLTGSFADPALPWRRRWQLFSGRKIMPPRSWWLFTRLHGGPLWPAMFVWPYARMAAQAFGLGRPGTHPQSSH